MDILENNELLGKELVFFACHPEEMDEIFDEPIENHRNLFNFLDDSKYVEMYRLVDEIGNSAAVEASEITTEVKNRLLNKLEHVKSESIQLKEAWWESAIYIRKLRSQKKAKNIQCHVIIETDEGSLFARTWIRVNGVNRNTLSDVLSNSIGLPQINHKDYSCDQLVTASVNLRDAAAQFRTKESLYGELTSPLLNIKKSEWDNIFMLAAK